MRNILRYDLYANGIVSCRAPLFERSLFFILIILLQWKNDDQQKRPTERCSVNETRTLTVNIVPSELDPFVETTLSLNLCNKFERTQHTQASNRQNTSALHRPQARVIVDVKQWPKQCLLLEFVIQLPVVGHGVQRESLERRSSHACFPI